VLYTQLIDGQPIGESLQGAATIRTRPDRIASSDAVSSRALLLPAHPQGHHLDTGPPCCWLDEHSQGDPEFEPFLLEVLADTRVTCPEVGPSRSATSAGGATSNTPRAVDRRLKRRCSTSTSGLPRREAQHAKIGPRPAAADLRGAGAQWWTRAARSLAGPEEGPSLRETLD